MTDALKFRGIASATLDAKGRMALPARHREIVAAVSQGAVVVTISAVDLCLRLYPRSIWEAFQDRLESLPNVRPSVRRIQQMMIGHATDLELDGNGRLLLPAKLREYAGLSKKLCLVGLGEKVEIWDDDRWNSITQDFREALAEDKDGQLSEIQELTGLSI